LGDNTIKRSSHSEVLLNVLRGFCAARGRIFGVDERAHLRFSRLFALLIGSNAGLISFDRFFRYLNIVSGYHAWSCRCGFEMFVGGLVGGQFGFRLSALRFRCPGPRFGLEPLRMGGLGRCRRLAVLGAALACSHRSAYLAPPDGRSPVAPDPFYETRYLRIDGHVLIRLELARQPDLPAQFLRDYISDSHRRRLTWRSSRARL